MKKLNLICACVFLLLPFSLFAQGELDERAMIQDFKGLDFMIKDSSFYINFRFRMQNRLGLYSESGNDLHIREVEARVRRLRMRIDGFILTQKLAYSIQLSFSRGDVDYENTGFVNIIRDAVMFYHFNDWVYLGFGLNKQPGNRQRVTSSGQLQFPDRSIVNGAFNIDRDFGLKAYFHPHAENHYFNIKLALTTGEGRSVNVTDDGLAYTGRFEWLPLGEFTRDGDYSEGDFEREKKPKLSVASGYCFNNHTTRTGGQIGVSLYEPRDIGTWISDLLFKYKGWAYSVEYIKRTSDNPVTLDENGNVAYVYEGQGTNHQFSYCFPKKYEVAMRYSVLFPDDAIESYADRTDVVEAGATKYLRGHRIKVQCSVFYSVNGGKYYLDNPKNFWGTMLQVELGI